MPVEDGLGNRLLRERLTRPGSRSVPGPEIIDVEAEDVPVLDRMGDGIGVELFLEEILRGSQGGDACLDLPHGRVVLEDRGAGETEELGVREELLDGPVVLAELRAMALVEDEDHPPVLEPPEPLPER